MIGETRAAFSISVIIPLYNKRDTIERCLDSILAQKIKPHEIIVINDGSTDDSLNVVESYVAKKELKEIRVFSRENKGVSITRNEGVETANGDYIAFLDADDFWHPEFLKVISELIETYPGAAMYSSGHTLKLGSNELNVSCGVHDKFSGVVNDYFRTSIRGQLVNSSKVIIPRNIFIQAGGFPKGKRVGEDIYLWSLLATKGATVVTGRRLVTIVQEADASRAKRKGHVPFILEHYASQVHLQHSSALIKYLKYVYVAHMVQYRDTGDDIAFNMTYSFGRKLFPHTAKLVKLALLTIKPKIIRNILQTLRSPISSPAR